MNDHLFLIALMICLAYAVYKSIKTKNERLFYAILVGTSVFSAKEPFHVPFEIVFSFNGFLGLGFILYQIAKQKLTRPCALLGIFCVIAGNIFLLKRFFLSEYTQFWVSLELAFGISCLAGFAVILAQILRKKLESTLLVFDLVLLWFGISLVSHPFFFH